MESYPGELLVGVFPLVFCVDASLQKDVPAEQAPSDEQANEDDEVDPEVGISSSAINDFDNPSEAPTFQPPLPGSKKASSRSHFERFLDAMAASLTDQEEDHPLRPNESSSRRGKTMSLFRPEDDDDSDDEDEAILNGSTPSSGSFDMSRDNSSLKKRTSFSSPSLSMAFPRRIGRGRTNTGGSAADINSTKDSSIVGILNPSNNATQPGAPQTLASLASDTSYAKALQNGEEFFQRARIVSISSRHGFPPSKDSSGEDNIIQHFAQAKTLDFTKIFQELCQYPITGILPSGWLEKHARALPSVLLVVANVQGGSAELNSAQEEQDQQLLDTLNNIQQCMASKRDCKIHVIGLVKPGTSEIQADQWSQTMTKRIFEETGNAHSVTLLTVSEDLAQDMPTSSAMRLLHRTIQTASMEYYLNQARACKRKLHRLGDGRMTPLLMPLSIRYCFKVAVYYEFQFKHEKSLRFFAEAYRHIENYFRYLLEQRSKGPDTSGLEGMAAQVFGQKKQDINIWNPAAGTAADSGEGVEVSFPAPVEKKEEPDPVVHMTPPPPPEDMVFQCRAMADWLNFKLVHAGFASRTQGGILAATYQWQRHCQTFCNPRRSFLGTDASMLWQDWLHVSRQRTMISQLLERNPPRALGELDQVPAANTGKDSNNNNNRELEEVLMRCSSWRTYEAAAESLLQLSAHLKRTENEPSLNQADRGETDDSNDVRRPRFVGSIAKEGFAPLLEEELKQNHRERALDCAKRAITLYEQAMEKAKKDTGRYQKHSWSRSGARMHYLSGGILLGLERHSEAISHLEKAVKYAKGWKGLELAIRRMLIECYEKHIPSQADDGKSNESNQSIASTILDSYFNAEMSNSNLRRALEKFSSLSDAGSIQWYRDCIDEADSSLPFSFAVTFPKRTHATAGDSVQASILIKSNLDYAAHVSSVTLLSMAGEIEVPPNDMLSAKNANVGSDGGIIVQAKTEIWVSSQIDLPRDLERIAIDESGNGGQKQGVAGKGSFAKTARPRMGGITAAAGARLVSEDKFGNAFGRPRNAQWSNKCLGGKPLRCDGMRLVFYPLYVEAAGQGKGCKIELTIEKRLLRTAADIKRTPFEEDNYIASAWTRPKHLPFEHGPRCLRVLEPAANMVVTNVTESFTNGKLLEGTVNRVLLKLQSGPSEKCSQVTLRVKCASLLITKQGKAMNIQSPAENPDEMDNVLDATNPSVRTPVLVQKSDEQSAAQTEFGYNMPVGWNLVDGGQRQVDGQEITIPVLKSGGIAYTYFDLYRPSRTMPGGADDVQEAMCQTDVDVTVSYHQERETNKKKKIPVRRRGRARPNPAAAPPGSSPDEAQGAAAAEDNDIVTMEYSTSMFWSTALTANFKQGKKLTCPSGNCHPSNTTEQVTSESKEEDASHDLILIDGEKISTRCFLEAASSADSMLVSINKVAYMDKHETKPECNFRPLSGKKEGDAAVIYEAASPDSAQKLVLGTKFAVVWTSQAKMNSDPLKGSVSAPLGMLSVSWTPTSLKLPEGVAENSTSEIGAHGPLPLTEPSTCVFKGPSCYVESAPFEAIVENLPASPPMAVPFDVAYRITNKTTTEQRLAVFVEGCDTDNGGNIEDGVLISGLLSGEVLLGPNESHVLSYTAIATRVGKVVLPSVFVSSNRYKTWVIRDDSPISRTVFVVP